MFVHSSNSLKLCSGVQPREGYEMDVPEKLEEAGKRKDAGNSLFKQGK